MLLSISKFGIPRLKLMYPFFLTLILLFYPMLHANEFSEYTHATLDVSFSYLEDVDHEYDIKTLLQDSQFKKFEPLASNQKSFGLTNSRYWIKAVVLNNSQALQEALIKFEYPLLDHVIMYHGSNNVITQSSSGDTFPISKHYNQDVDIIFPITLAHNETKTIYFRIDSSSSMDIRLNLLDMQEYYESRLIKQSMFALLYGGSIIMVLYNLFLFLSIRERSYFYYVLFQTSNLITLTSLSGIAFYYIWPENPQWNNAIPSLIVLSDALAIMFTRNFLDTTTKMPKIDQILRALLGLFSLGLLFTFFSTYHLGIIVATASILITTFSLVTVGFIAFYRNIRASKFYLLAWILLLIGATLTGFKNIGLLPITFLTTWGVQIGAFFELLLLSFGLADRINMMRKEQHRLQELAAHKAQSLAEVLEESKIKLEQQVIKRTQALKTANITLKEIITSKEALLKELHHRVKNNLQVIIAMMSLQKRQANSQETKEFIDKSNARLQSMAIVHNMLYRTDDLTKINMKEYLQELINTFHQGLGSHHQNISYKLSDMYLDLDQAISIGLICNEVITNTFKHAYDDSMKNRKLHVLLKQDNQKIILGIKDNGKGFDRHSVSDKSLGMILIDDFSSKFHNSNVRYKTWNGTYFRMEFTL